MTMTTEPTRHDPSDALLDALFGQAQAAKLHPVPDALMARVLADADAAMPRAPAPALALAPRPAGWLTVLVTYLGGRGAVAGMVSAGLAGVWIGLAQPVTLPFAVSTPADIVDLYPADLDLWGEILAADAANEG